MWGRGDFPEWPIKVLQQKKKFYCNYVFIHLVCQSNKNVKGQKITSMTSPHRKLLSQLIVIGPDVSVSVVLQDCSDWPNRLCELQRQDWKWHYWPCSIGQSVQKSKTLSVCTLREQLYWNEWPAMLDSGGLAHSNGVASTRISTVVSQTSPTIVSQWLEPWSFWSFSLLLQS